MKRILLLLLFLIPSLARSQEAIMKWDFENIQNRNCIENLTGIHDTIEGNFDLAQGMSGKGLRLDGFTTRVIRKGSVIRKPGNELTVEAWISLGEYPLNWCPVLTTESDEAKGFRLRIGPYGQVSFETAIAEQWISCTSARKTIPLRTWMHIAGVYTAGKELKLYINGELATSVAISGSMTFPANASCIIGMVPEPGKPSDVIRTWATVDAFYGLDGIVDEIKVYDKALSEGQIKSSFSKYIVHNPDIAPRKLPTITNNPHRFGAYYTKLKYYAGWDNLWPVDQDPDIVVCFEKSPVKLIFWRGTRYGPCWVSENENWMADQSLETWAEGKEDKEGCFEHMQDRHCRFSHVRIIENNDGRVVIHWRYAPVSSHDNTWMQDPKTGWECWVDEYYYIYPDGSAIRKVSWNQGTVGPNVQYQESLPLTQPGQRNDEVLNNDYVHVADYNYHMRSVDVNLRQEPADWFRNYTVQQFNFKSENKPYICFEQGNEMWVRWIDVGYNHFPVNQARCDGRWTKTLDRPSHISSSPISDPVIHEEGNRNFWNGLYGMNNMDMSELVSFGRSWAFPAVISVNGNDYISKGYDKSQRCYQLEKVGRKGESIEITLQGTKDSPVINPVFHVRNWNSERADVLVNGKLTSNCRVGINHELDGSDLVLFLEINEIRPVKIIITP